MRTALWLLISCTACHRATPITFTVEPRPDVVEVERRHRLSLELGIGFDGELDPQRWEQQGFERVRLERTTSGVVVRCLEAGQRDGEVVAPSGLEGLSARVLASGVEPTDPTRPLTPPQRGAMAAWASALEPDTLQLALWSRSHRVRETNAELDDAFATLVGRALGPGSVVEHASLRLVTATEAVAVFDAAVAARVLRGELAISTTLSGTLTVSRSGAVPLSLALEGPVQVSAPEHEGTPALRGAGQLQVARQVRLIEPGSATVAER
ncbi:MAG: hypothetical protein SFW67_21835 [Myxococcaceae bacterium]|nr:hypothetical protein [Myxococcaceae bacterium]